MSERLAGLLLPAFSPRREGDLGIGDTRAMREWIDLAAENGMGFVQLLPINETGSDDSPYNAISSVALEPLYLTMEEVPGLTDAELNDARERVEAVGDLGEGVKPSASAVDYHQVRRVKRALLELAWARWDQAGSALHEAFEAFRRKESDWLGDYCAYRWLMDRAGGTEAWDLWPRAWHSVTGARQFLEMQREMDEAMVDSRLSFFAWVQWLCFQQWRDVRRYGDSKGVKLMGDIPIGVSRYSADVFFGRKDFDLNWCGGAPPETMFKHDRFIQKWGQNWGIPLYRWDRMEEEGFPWWRQRIDKLTDIFRIFRIDHILGFYRIYAFPWRPQQNGEFLELDKKEAAKRTGGELPGWSPRPDDTVSNKAANCADGDLRLKVILEAAGDAEVVGEDLGCVPDYVRPHLASLEIAGFRIPHWDFDEEGKVIPGDELPECSFATYATHDHHPIPAMWEDLRAQSVDESLEKKERVDAAEQLRLMMEFAGIKRLEPFTDEILWKLINALMASKSRYAAIMVNDLFGMTDRINQPGTVGPQNWTFRLPKTAQEYRNDPAWGLLKASVADSARSQR
ncbi:4-alpha-glucanotransferase [Haloferula chungangensis]|uniref:4-alpha-glucanotransferase n=1 Tax=Haloferula chungangensis TaxID=1048331 RepID=A0ABW2L0G9_9BACT